jgi:oxygen-independent coproporphyrinogen-3 oxidase
MHFHPPSTLDQQSINPAEVFSAGLKLHHLANTAYPIGHLTTMRDYRLPNSQAQALAQAAWREVTHLGLYVHIPFCEQRCGYCKYTVLDPATRHLSQPRYFDLLQREFELYRSRVNTPGKTLIGFDIGGGTPTAAPVAELARVVEAARASFCLPETVTISIETTPKIAAREPEKIQALYDLGIRRISMGVQTISPRLLQEVGRDSTSLSFNRAATEHIRRAGFGKFNIDVMYGFAGQSLGSVEATLRHVVSLAPEYITLYRMRYKGTSIAFQAQEVSRAQVAAQYALAKALLLEAGYFATPGKNTFSRLPGDPGASDYLTERVIHGTPYLGLGLGAQSLSELTLSYNAGAADKRLEHYQRLIEAGKLPLQDIYHLSPAAAMGKMISVAFYFGEVHLSSLKRKFGLSLEAAFPAEVEFVLRQGLMDYAGEGEARTLRLTEAGVAAYNGVIALFYAGAVKAHLLRLAAENSNRWIRAQLCVSTLPRQSALTGFGSLKETALAGT